MIDPERSKRLASLIVRTLFEENYFDNEVEIEAFESIIRGVLTLADLHADKAELRVRARLAWLCDQAGHVADESLKDSFRELAALVRNTKERL